MRHEVSEESLSSWKRTGNVITEEIPGPGTTRHPVTLPFSDTYVKIILQAHNEFGYSSESVLVIRAIKGAFWCVRSLNIENDTKGSASPLNDGSGGEFTASQLPLIPIIGALVCVLLICILLIDLSCYKINKTGK